MIGQRLAEKLRAGERVYGTCTVTPSTRMVGNALRTGTLKSTRSGGMSPGELMFVSAERHLQRSEENFARQLAFDSIPWAEPRDKNLRGEVKSNVLWP